MITYRTFRNWDPPALAALWNSGVSGRGAARAIGPQDLDRLIFSKPYFDPQGITLALSDQQPVGFVHAGFGPASDNSRLCHDVGVITMLVVTPAFRRRGIGRTLVRHAETYLRAWGSSLIYAGSLQPLDPFYHGLYGGSEMPGILRSSAAAHELFCSMHYQPADECLVFQRPLAGPVYVADPRCRAWARRLDFVVAAEPVTSDWWSACRYSSHECTRFELRLKSSGEVIACAAGWGMYPLDRAWGADAAGIVGVTVAEPYRNQGVGTWLGMQILRHYRDNGVTLAEVQTMARNAPAQRLYRRLGFAEVDRGVVYRCPARPPDSAAPEPAPAVSGRIDWPPPSDLADGARTIV